MKYSSIILWFLSRETRDKSYLIALEVNMLLVTIIGVGLQRMVCFSTNQTKVQILDYRQTTHKVNVSGILFSFSPKQNGRRTA